MQAWADYAKTRSARHKLLKFLREHDETQSPAPGKVGLSCGRKLCLCCSLGKVRLWQVGWSSTLKLLSQGLPCSAAL